MHLAAVYVLHCCAVITDEEHKACFDNNVQPISCGADRERCARELYGHYSPFTSYGLYTFTSTHLYYLYIIFISPQIKSWALPNISVLPLKGWICYLFQMEMHPMKLNKRPSNLRTFYLTSSITNKLFCPVSVCS